MSWKSSALLTGLLFLSWSVQAQSPFKPIQPRGAPPGNDERNVFREIMAGRVPANDFVAKKVPMERVAEWYLHRFLDPAIQNGTTTERIGKPARPLGMNDLLEELFDRNRGVLPYPPDRPPDPKFPDEREEMKNKRAFVIFFRKEVLLPKIQELLQSDQLIVRVNMARVLMRLLEESHFYLSRVKEMESSLGKEDLEGYEKLADELIRIIESPHEHNAVKLYAFQGLALPVRYQRTESVLGYTQPILNPVTVQRYTRVLFDWVNQNCRLTEADLAKMSVPEQDGLRYVRRSAIRALGVFGVPLLMVKDGQGERSLPVATLLYQIMRGNKELIPGEDVLPSQEQITPEPSWSERVEAACGLCLMRYKPLPGSKGPIYQADFVAYAIGQFLIKMMAETNDKPEQERWIYFALRLRSGCEELPKSAEGSANKTEIVAYHQAFLQLATPLLEKFFPQTVKQIPGKDFPVDYKELNNWLNTTNPNKFPSKNPFHPPLTVQRK